MSFIPKIKKCNNQLYNNRKNTIDRYANADFHSLCNNTDIVVYDKMSFNTFCLSTVNMLSIIFF